MKYFSIERIKQSSRHLENFRSGWVIVPFVFAANGVNSKDFTDLHSLNGTDGLLDKYFGGALIGLKAGASGNSLRPRFKEIMPTFNHDGKAGDFAINQATKLWANAYSSRGYREMVNRGELEAKDTAYKLTDKFQPKFEAELPATFKFEEFLVWLYAFRGVPDEVNSWAELYDDLLKDLKVPGGKFAPEFLQRFRLEADEKITWPTDFLPSRPADEEYQLGLLPSLSKKGAVASRIQPDDPSLARVITAIDAGERNFLFYGPPGTGKSLYAHEIALHIAEGQKERIAKIQFHPSFSYDDFVEGYAPKKTDKGAGVTYELVDRHFLLLCKAAKDAPEKQFVLVVDEVSRGDASRIFGDVLTYIDKDYRDEEFRLSYSGDPVSVPQNLIIIGTTNPYDRSVAELDDALLRRFYMVEFAPSEAALGGHFKETGMDGAYTAKVMRFFSQINKRMPHGFGHAHFFNLEGPEQLRDEWTSKLRFLVRRALQFDGDVITEIDALFDELFPVKADAEAAMTTQAPAAEA